VTETAGSVIKPPWPLLLLGGLAAILSFALIFPGERPGHFAGYLLGTFGVILLIAQFRRSDARRSSSPLYSPIRLLSQTAVAVLVVGVGCGAVNIYYLAQRVAG
jgi:hypothetical protein